jgi:predicted nucleic acid-binding protein
VSSQSSRAVEVAEVADEALVVDTSAWIEFLKSTGSAVHRRLVEAVESETTIVVPEVVRMELLIGGTSEDWTVRRRRMLDTFDVEPAVPLVDSEAAAAIHRACRRGGETVRNLLDCQVAATAIRMDLPVLHRDRDFEVIARHTRLRVLAVS